MARPKNQQERIIQNNGTQHQHRLVPDQLQLCISTIRFLLVSSFIAVCLTSTYMFEEINLQNLLLSPEARLAQHNRPFVILVQLSGEFGNHLSKIAYGRAIQLWLQEEFDVPETRLVMRHQGARYVYKWQKATTDLKQCFPWTKQFNFSQGNDKAVYDDFVQQYSSNRTSKFYKLYEGVNQNMGDTQIVGDTLRKAVKQYEKVKLESPEPFILYVNQFLHSNHFLMDRYYNEFRKIFQMSTKCCPTFSSKIPDATRESVMHVRNYLEEMPRRKGPRAGPYQEANSETVAKILFKDLVPGKDKVVIVGPTTPGRFRGNSTGAYNVLEAHKEALQNQGIETRIFTGLNDMEDFCFLIRTKQDLVGLETSTFMYWAAMLGQSRHARLYTIEGEKHEAATKTWANPNLLGRVQFESIYQSNQ